MKTFPVIKVAIIFIAGILSAQFIQIEILFLLIPIAVFSILFIYNQIIKKIKYHGILILVIGGFLIFSVGNLLANYNKVFFDPYLTSIDKVRNTTAVGRITKIDLLKNDELNFYLSADSMYSDEFSIKNNLNLLCKVKADKRPLSQLFDQLQPGNKIKVTGFYHKGNQKRNPGEFDYDAYLKSKNIVGILNINEISDIRILNHQSNFFSNFIYHIKVSIDNQIKKIQSPEAAGLLRGLLLADRGDIDYQTKTQFINAGVIHVLAVSGLHVVYIVFIFVFLFGRLNIFLRSILIMIGLIFYMAITGIQPSVFRAVVMAIVVYIAILSNRSTNLFNSISIAAIIILILNPNDIYNPGFLLSFSAVLSIAIILPYLNAIIEKWNIENKIIKSLIIMCAVSLSAQIGTIPFTLLYFNKFSIISLFANMIVIPAFGLILALAIATLLISVIFPFAAIYLAAANDLVIYWILEIIKFSSELSFSYVNIYNYSLVDLIIFYLLLALLLYFLPRFESVKSKVVLLILICANTFIYSSVDDFELFPDSYLSVLMIDVGQGDSFLIRFPDGKTALVDAGNATLNFDYGERVILPLLNYLGINKIDYGIVTHIDTDHYGGYVSLILNGMIGEIFKPDLDSSLSKDIRFENFIKENGISINYFKEEQLEIGNTNIYFLYDKDIKKLSGKSANNRSGVFKLIYGRTSFLFTGDVEKPVEKFYANKYQHFLDSDVLKVSHHGSKTSSSQAFLNFVTPEVSLVSAGYKNKFGHPIQEVIERIQNYGSKIYRTDLQKAILLRSDGNNIIKINW